MVIKYVIIIHTMFLHHATFLAVNLKFSSVIAGFLPHGNSQKLILAAPWHAAGEGLFLFSIWIGFAIQVWDVIFTALEEYLNFK